MKSKLLISVLLALVMLVTLTAPALAGKPFKAYMFKGTETQGTVQCALQTTHDNYIKLAFVAKGVTGNRTYHVWVYDNTSPYYDWHYAGSFQADENGKARARTKTSDTFADGYHVFHIRLTNSSTTEPIYASSDYFFATTAHDILMK